MRLVKPTYWLCPLALWILVWGPDVRAQTVDSTTYYIGNKDTVGYSYTGIDFRTTAKGPTGTGAIFDANAGDTVIRFWYLGRTNNDAESLHMALYYAKGDTAKVRVANSYTGFTIPVEGSGGTWHSSPRVSIPLIDTNYIVAYGNQVQLGTLDNITFWKKSGTGNRMVENTATGLDDPFGGPGLWTEYKVCWAEVLRVSGSAVALSIGGNVVLGAKLL